MRSTWAEQALAVVRKDLLLELRSRVAFNATLFFAAMVVLMFSFALGPDSAHLRAAAGGLLWLAFIFAGLLAIGHIYQVEAENSAFEGAVLTAEWRSAIYAGKMLGAVAVMAVIEVIVLPLMALLYSFDVVPILPGLALVALLGTVGFASIGTLYGAMTMSVRAREVLLPLLLLPVVVPVVVAAVKAATLLLTQAHPDIHLWLELLVVYDVIFVTVGLVTYEYVVGQ